MKNSHFFFFALMFLNASGSLFSQGIVIDHSCAKLSPIPESAILNAKQVLHIAYGHTSHGSQLITGMTGLIGQTSLIGYKGDVYQWNEGGVGGALDIDDEFAPGDLGHNGDVQWAAYTRSYLDDPENSGVNVIIWSWCGGCSDNTPSGIQTYLNTMNQLELEYPDVTFVYMTGHLDIWADALLKANNQQIRDFCINNNKVLYDFADIESYNPDGNYYLYATDNCDYYSSPGGTCLGNWAIEWQNSHTEGVDWYICSAAHTEALNGNLKAYSAWWLWCRIAGWNGVTGIENIKDDHTFMLFPNPAQVFFIINGTTAIDHIDVYFQTGKFVQRIIKPETHVDISTWAKGIYFVRINTAKGYLFKKFIKE